MDDVFRRLARLESLVRSVTANAIRFSTVSKTSADGQSDQVRGRAVDPSDGADYSYPVRRMSTWGVRSVPPAGVDALILHVNGGNNNGVMIGNESARFGPSDLLDGELAIYNKATGCVIKMDQNGAITITASSGQNITLNGGTQKVARVGDATAGHAHIEGGNAGPYPVVGNTQSQTDTINAGAANVLA